MYPILYLSEDVCTKIQKIMSLCKGSVILLVMHRGVTFITYYVFHSLYRCFENEISEYLSPVSKSFYVIL